MTVCYFTGSGKCLYVARRIGGTLLSIPQLMRQESAMPYCGETIRSFQGRALAVLRSRAGAGEVRVTVSAEGVEPAVLTLRAE